MQKLLNLGAETVALPEGYIEITDTSEDVMKALDLLGVQVKTLPDGRVVITDNSAKIRDDINRNLSRRVLDRAGTVTLNIVENIRSVFSRSTGGSTPRRATGGGIPRLAGGDRTHGGYRLPMSGPGTDRTDGILGLDAAGVPTAWVDRGEYVTNRAATGKWIRTLTAINQDDPVAVLKAMLFELPQLQNGGVLSASQIKAALSDMDNGRYVMGGFSTDATDCSGGVSAVVNTALGLPRFESRMSTVTIGSWLENKGFQPGRGDADDIVVGWYDYGGGAAGHTSIRLQDGTYIESGGNTGQGFTIGGKAGGLDGRGYTNFMHLPYDSSQDSGDGFLTGDDGARVSMGSGVSHRAEFDGIQTVSGSASGVGSTVGRSFNQPGLASNTTSTSVGSALGGSIAGQITSMAEQHGFGPQVSQILGASTNMEVFLRVTPETVEAFNKL
ncbi:MAG TPA: phage tail tape measure protein, partial [Corynebacterium sp.]|nr:phage tail tape measure protein [Corynebacterium sp.]